MFSLHCSSCDATYLMGVSAIAAALSSGSAIETSGGTMLDVLCPFGHPNSTGFNARLDSGAPQPLVDGFATAGSSAARLAV